MLEAAFSKLVESLVIPAMISDFMTFRDGPLQEFGMFLHHLPKNEEGNVNVAFFEDVEKLWGVKGIFTIGARAIVKGHRDVGTIHMNGGNAASFPTLRGAIQ